MAQRKGARKTAPKSGAVSAGGARIIDLDAARAARAEKRGDAEPPRIRLEGTDWELPVEVPVEFAVRFEVGDLRGGLSALLGEDAAEIIESLSVDDLEVLSDGIYEIYGLDEGK